MMPPLRRPSARRGLFLFSLSFWVPVAIVAFFGAMMFLLWKREMGERYAVKGLGISPDFLTATWMDFEQYMWVEQGDRRIGVYALTVRRDDQLGVYELALRSRLRLNVLNIQMPVRLDGLVMLDGRFVMDTFQASLVAAGQRVQLEALTDGLDLYYRVTGPPELVAEGELASRAALKSPVILADAVRPLVTKGRRLRVGDRWSTRASDPFTGQLDMVVTVEVTAEEWVDMDGISVRAFRVVEATKDVATTSWYDLSGDLLRTDLGNGLVMVRADREAVFAFFPGLKVPPNFPDLDKPAFIAAAKEHPPAEGQNPLAWLPKL